MATVELTEKTFQQIVDQDGIVLIDCWAPWCGPCRAFGPVFEKASEAHSDIVFGKVNTEQEQELAARFNIRSIPTLMIFRDRILLFSQPGALPASTLEELIGKVKGLDMDQIRKEVEAEQAAREHTPHAQATARPS
jgi:thioredoxin 1